MATDDAQPTQDRPRVAVVLSGAVARGAFQAGALAELIPALERDGQTPTIWVGTSAGGINAVGWGAAAHRGVGAAAEEVLGFWRHENEHDVYAPLAKSTIRAGLEFAAGALLSVGSGTTSLLDTAPLRRAATARLDPEQLAANVADGVLDAIGVVATRTDPEDDVEGVGGRSVLFLDEHAPSGYQGDETRALDVVHGPVTTDHVLASSAFPVAFPPVQVRAPEQAAGWYLDGGVRLNTPLHPAIGLGATRIVLVSATATNYRPPQPPDLSSRTPDIADAAAQVLLATLGDRTSEDLLTLRRINRLVAQATADGHPGSLTDHTGRPFRIIEVMVVSPPCGELGWIASQVYDRTTAGLGWLSEVDDWIVGRVIRGLGDGAGRRELLSYLLLHEDYFAAGIDLGRQAARSALHLGWQL